MFTGHFICFYTVACHLTCEYNVILLSLNHVLSAVEGGGGRADVQSTLMDEKEVGCLVFCLCLCGVYKVYVYEYICMCASLSCRYSPCVLKLELECYHSVPMHVTTACV